MNAVVKVLIYIAVAAAVLLASFLIYKLIRFLVSKNVRVSATAVRIFKLILLIAVIMAAGYFVFTGFQI